MSPRRQTIDDWGKWITRGVTSGTCVFLINWGIRTSDALEAIKIMESAQVEKNRALDAKDMTHDQNFNTLFTSRDLIIQQISDLYRYHPKK